LGLFDRLLYYPPLIIDDDKNENFIKGSYCHQKTNFDETKLGSLDIKDEEDEEAATAEHVCKGDVNKNITRCGAHCVSISLNDDFARDAFFIEF
jgi:hypothetical protein